jgi:methanethiol S-methyltransferase
MARLGAFLYGLLAYVIFLITFLYAIGFVGNLVVPKSIDSGGGAISLDALLIDVLLLLVFAFQHSVMARPGFKRAWTRMIPRPVERSTYVLLASACLQLLYWQWRPMTEVIWNVDGATARWSLLTLCALGWLTVLGSTFLASHTDLFGLRQVSLYMRGEPYAPIALTTGSLYKQTRHPLYLGFLVAFWAAPQMTVGHLLFALATTGYILLAIQLEERDLVHLFGDTYRLYRQRTPMLLPFTRWSRQHSDPASAQATRVDTRMGGQGNQV